MSPANVRTVYKIGDRRDLCWSGQRPGALRRRCHHRRGPHDFLPVPQGEMLTRPPTFISLSGETLVVKPLTCLIRVFLPQRWRPQNISLCLSFHERGVPRVAVPVEPRGYIAHGDHWWIFLFVFETFRLRLTVSAKMCSPTTSCAYVTWRSSVVLFPGNQTVSGHKLSRKSKAWRTHESSEHIPYPASHDASLISPRSRSQAISDKFGPVSLVHFDSHFDTWDEYFGEKCTHGTPFKRVSSGISSLCPRPLAVAPNTAGITFDSSGTQRV